MSDVAAMAGLPKSVITIESRAIYINYHHKGSFFTYLKYNIVILFVIRVNNSYIPIK